MAAIEIPDDYWTPEPPVFAALVQGFSPAFAEVAGGLDDATNGLAADDAGDTGAALATLDGDADVIDAQLADEAAAADATPTSDVLDNFATGDSLNDQADGDVGAVMAASAAATAPATGAPPDASSAFGNDDNNSDNNDLPPREEGPQPTPDPPPPTPTPEPEPAPEPEPEPPAPEPPAPEPEPEPLPSNPTVDPGGGVLPGGPDPGGDAGGVVEAHAGPRVVAAPNYVTYDDLAAVIGALDLTINVQV